MKKVEVRAASILLMAAALIWTVALAAMYSPEASAATSPVQGMVGRWDGFIAKMGDPPQLLRTEITSQTNRRFIGSATPPDPVLPISFEGTVSASGKVNFQGNSADGSHTVGKTDLTDFGDGAAILNGSMTRFSNDGTFIIPCVLVMRPFATNSPEPVQPAGRYVGSLNTAGVAGQIEMVLGAPPDPIRPTSFGGNLQIVLNGQTHSFPLFATGNSEGRVIAIGHGTTAHLILDAVLAAPPDPVQPTTLVGNFKLEFVDGSEVEGTFQTEQTRTNPT